MTSRVTLQTARTIDNGTDQAASLADLGPCRARCARCARRARRARARRLRVNGGTDGPASEALVMRFLLWVLASHENGSLHVRCVHTSGSWGRDEPRHSERVGRPIHLSPSY